MIFQAVGSSKKINVDIKDYLIDWDRVVSKPQKAVKDFLYFYWKGKVILEEFKMPGQRLRFDIVNMTDWIIVEVSPKKVHGQFNKFFHRTRQGYAKSIKRDLEKHDWCEKNGFTLVEVFDEDIGNLTEDWFREKYNVEL